MMHAGVRGRLGARLVKLQGRWAAAFSPFSGLMYFSAVDLFSTKTPFHVFVNNFTFSKQSAIQPAS